MGVNMELYASYVYTSMFTYFARDDLALPGFADFFSKTAAKEWHHGAILMKYQTKRVGDGLGIHIVDRDIARMAAHIVDKYLVRTVRNEHDTTFIPSQWGSKHTLNTNIMSDNCGCGEGRPCACTDCHCTNCSCKPGCKK